MLKLHYTYKCLGMKFFMVAFMNNVRDTNYFIKKITNYWCGEWLLVNKKVILIIGLDEN